MNMNWDAAFAACKSYDDTEVSAALQTAVDAAALTGSRPACVWH